MPLMTSIYTGVTGLRANQNALNTTAHNLANINTTGYVRQQASMVDGIYSRYGYSAVNTMQIGLGVVSAETRHIRDLLLDKAYREQVGRQQFYAAKYDVAEEVDIILGELEGVQFQQSLEDLKLAIAEMAKTPNSTVSRAGLIMSAQAFMSRANAVYEDLVAYQQTLDQKVIDTVTRINQIGRQIHAINLQVAKVEAPNIETASDLRDARDVLLDELSGLAKISYSENEDGIVSVKIENVAFVSKDGIYEMGMAPLHTDMGSTYLSPVWPHVDNAPVFDTYTATSTGANNDIGELKGALIARGGFIGTYHDIPRQPDYSQYATDAEKVAAYEKYQAEVKVYNETVGNTVISKAQALFDQMINNIVTLINDAISPKTEQTLESDITMTVSAGTIVKTLDKALQDKLEGATLDKHGALVSDVDITLTAGTTITVLDMEKTSYGCDDDKTPGTELFTRLDVERYTKVQGSDGNTYYVYNPYNEFGNESNYSLLNLKINDVVVDNYAFIPFTTKNEDVDLELGQELIKIWNEPSINLDPSNLTPKDFDDYYSGMMGILANEGYAYHTVAESQKSVVLNIDSHRTSITGVSEEEELSNMIKFKNAYDASSRYINAVTEMLDTLINRVGRA